MLMPMRTGIAWMSRRRTYLIICLLHPSDGERLRGPMGPAASLSLRSGRLLRPPVGDVPLARGGRGVALEVMDLRVHQPYVLAVVQRELVGIGVGVAVNVLDLAYGV